MNSTFTNFLSIGDLLPDRSVPISLRLHVLADAGQRRYRQLDRRVAARSVHHGHMQSCWFKRPSLQPSAVGFGPLCRPRRGPRHPLVSGEWNDIAEVIGMEDFNVSVSYVTESRSVTWLRPYSYAHFPPGPVRALSTI